MLRDVLLFGCLPLNEDLKDGATRTDGTAAPNRQGAMLSYNAYWWFLYGLKVFFPKDGRKVLITIGMTLKMINFPIYLSSWDIETHEGVFVQFRNIYSR